MPLMMRMIHHPMTIVMVSSNAIGDDWSKSSISDCETPKSFLSSIPFMTTLTAGLIHRAGEVSDFVNGSSRSTSKPCTSHYMPRNAYEVR